MEEGDIQVLERILEEIDAKLSGSMGRKREGLLEADKIIRKYMNGGWIPVEERLPESNRKIEEDADCPEYNVTIQGAEKSTTLKYSPADCTWFDDFGYVYPVIAWRHLPDPYHPERRDNHDGE